MRSLILSLLFLIFSIPAHALTGPWQETERVQARLVSTVTATGDLAEIPLGLEVRLAPTWHSYWRSPGEAGLPPQMDWKTSTNVEDIQIDYPWPERKIILGIENFLYEHEVIYPLRLMPEQIGQPISIKANLSLLTCADICVPNDLTLTLDIPAGALAASAESARIADYAARVPLRDLTPPVIQNIRLDNTLPGVRFDLVGKTLAENFMVIGETPLNLRFNAATVTNLRDQVTELALPLTNAEDFATLQTVSSLTINLNTNLADSANAEFFEQKIDLTPPAIAPSTQPAEAPSPAFWLILIFALLGGLILNVMPCVLPVLSLKILSVIKHSEYGPYRIRASFLYSSAGIIASFLVLAIGLIALRSLGMTIGWGIQFQQPAFIAALLVIVLLFAANMFGWFEIRLGSNVQTALANTSNRKGHLGDFLQGAFATILATPCTAPFLGTAAGFAITASAPQIILIFLMMGIGLALPYLLLARFPKLVRYLPKPGQWMVRVRMVLGLALVATALWLGFVLAGQIHPVPMTHPQELADKKINWQKFDAARISELVQQGKVVFVDVTARWCLTCLYNKRTVIDTDPVVAALSRPDHVSMLADWTNPDPAITAYLQRYQRSGIPFNAVYGPGAPDGIILPELLTKEVMLNALQDAAKTR